MRTLTIGTISEAPGSDAPVHNSDRRGVRSDRGAEFVGPEVEVRSTERAPVVGKRAPPKAVRLIMPLSGNWSSKPRRTPHNLSPPSRCHAPSPRSSPTCDLGGREHRPDVLQGLRPSALSSDRGRRGDLTSASTAPPLRLLGADKPHQQAVRRCNSGIRPVKGVPLLTFPPDRRKEDVVPAYRADLPAT